MEMRLRSFRTDIKTGGQMFPTTIEPLLLWHHAVNTSGLPPRKSLQSQEQAPGARSRGHFVWFRFAVEFHLSFLQITVNAILIKKKKEHEIVKNARKWQREAEWAIKLLSWGSLGFESEPIAPVQTCTAKASWWGIVSHDCGVWEIPPSGLQARSWGAWGHSSSANVKSWKAGALTLGQKMVSAGAERVNSPPFPVLSLSGPQWVRWRPPAPGRVIFTVYGLHCWHPPETASQTHASVRFYQLFGPPLAHQADT